MSNLEKKTNLFFKQYNLEKRNYNIIIHGKNGLGKFDFYATGQRWQPL